MSIHLNPLVRASARNRAHTLTPLITGPASLLREGDRLDYGATCHRVSAIKWGDTLISLTLTRGDGTEPVYKVYGCNEWVAFTRYTLAGAPYRQCTGCGNIIHPDTDHHHDGYGKAHDTPRPFRVELAPFTGNPAAVCQRCGWRCQYWEDWAEDVETHECKGDA